MSSTDHVICLNGHVCCSGTPNDVAKNPAYIIAADFGPIHGTLKTSAQLTQRYNPEDLVGKQIVGVTNFPKKQNGPMMSEFLVLGALDSEHGTAILQVLKKVPPGTSIA